MQISDEKENLRNYLLGKIPETELERIDLRIIDDEEFSSDLFAVESELVEDYLDDTLSSSDAEAFRKNFLTNPERQSLLNELAALKTFARNQRLEEKETVSTPGEKRAWFARPWFLIPAFGVVVLVGFLAWQFATVTRLSPLEQEFAALNKDLSDTSSFKPEQIVGLASGVLRDGSGSTRRKLADLSDPILFRLAARPGENLTPRDVRVRRGNSIVFKIDSIKPNEGPNGAEYRVLLPKSIFGPGEFQLRLEDTASGSATNYLFIIDQ